MAAHRSLLFWTAQADWKQRPCSTSWRAEVGTLYLTHFSARYRDVKPLLEEARGVFPQTEAAHDFLDVEVKFPE